MTPMRACAEVWQRSGHAAIEWYARSLKAFGDQPLASIAGRYDILVIDHPLCGSAACRGDLVPFEDAIGRHALERLESSSVGASQRSYKYGGWTWGVATDAACQVSACRSDLLHVGLPATWPEAVRLVRALGTKAALPLTPAHAISSLLTLWAAAGLEPLTGGELVNREKGVEQVEWLIEMHRCGNAAATDGSRLMPWRPLSLAR